MRKTIISDASCLILLTNINELHLLQKLYAQIITTAVVAEEFGEPPQNRLISPRPEIKNNNIFLNKKLTGEKQAQ